jgi:tetratricopeptide (TPR) repeat protein
MFYCSLIKEAYQATMNQYKIAKERDISFYILDAIVSLVEINHDISSYQKDIEQIKKDYGTIPAYQLLFGRIERIQADKLFNGKKYDEAFQLYAQAIQNIDSHGGYYKYHIHDELNRLRDKLNSFSIEEKSSYLSILQNRLGDLHQYSKNLQEWIENEEFEL